jgi:hypothetical protein
MTPAEMAQEIIELKDQLAKQGLGNAIREERLKVDSPEKFTGNPLKLQPFLTQARLYLRYKKKSLPNEYDKVLGIATCLGGSALDWSNQE